MNPTPSLQSLIYRAKSTLKNKTGVDNPAIDALACAVGGAAFGQYGYADYLFKQMHPETCDEEWLYLHAERLKVYRISQTYAQGSCAFNQTSGVELVPVSTVLKTSDGKEYEVIIATNSDLPVALRALTPNTQGNLPAGESLYLVTAVTGLHPEGITSNEISGGAGIEELEHWRDRVLLAYNIKNAVGRLEDYKFWAVSAHADIDFAWALDNTPTLGQVTLFIAQHDDMPLLTEQIRITAQDYIDAERLAGCHVFTTLPTLKAIGLTISGVDDIDVRNTVNSALQNFFTTRVDSREPLMAHELSTVISGITPQFTLVSPSATTTFLNSELITFGGVTWQ